MSRHLTTPTPNHPEQALARAIAHGQRGQGAQALTALLQALDGGVDQQQPNHLISQRLISGAVPALGRAIAFAGPTADARRLQSLRRSLAAQPCRRAASKPAPTATGNSAARRKTAPAPSKRALDQPWQRRRDAQPLGQFKSSADATLSSAPSTSTPTAARHPRQCPPAHSSHPPGKRALLAHRRQDSSHLPLMGRRLPRPRQGALGGKEPTASLSDSPLPRHSPAGTGHLDGARRARSCLLARGSPRRC